MHRYAGRRLRRPESTISERTAWWANHKVPLRAQLIGMKLYEVDPKMCVYLSIYLSIYLELLI